MINIRMLLPAFLALLILAGCQAQAVASDPLKSRVTAAGEREFGLVDDFGERFPVFLASERYSRGKLVYRSALVQDPGDTPEIGFVIAGGGPDAATPVTKGWPGAFIYWTPLDSQLDLIPDDPSLPWAGTGPFYGRSAQLSARMTEDPTSTGRGGAFVISTTKNGEVALRERFWVSNKGFAVFGGRASYEDRAGGSVYPDTPAQNFMGTDGLERGVGSWLSGVQGLHDSLNTEGWGNVSIVASDCSKAASVAVRKYGATGSGFDTCYDWGDDELVEQSVSGGVKSKRAWRTLSGVYAFGASGGQASLRSVPVAGARNGVEAIGSTQNNVVRVGAFGADTDIDLRLAPKGAGAIEAGGAIKLPGMADSAAPSSSLYFSTTSGRPAWKDASGSVHNLY